MGRLSLLTVKRNPARLSEIMPQLRGRVIEKNIEAGRYREAVNGLVTAAIFATRERYSPESVAELDQAQRSLLRALEEVEHHLAEYPPRTPFYHRR